MRAALRIAFFYAVLAGLYLAFTHYLVASWAQDDSGRLESWRAVKGGIFIVVSAVLVFLLTLRFAYQRKQAILQLEDARRSFQQLFEGCPFPSWVYGADSLRMLAVNPPALTEYGYTQAEFLRLNATALHPIEEGDRFRAFAIRMSVFPSASQWHHVRKDGSVLETELTVSSIIFGGEDARLVIAHNVTRRRLAERVVGEALDPRPPSVSPLLLPVFTIRETGPLLQRLADGFLATVARNGIKLNLELDSSLPKKIALEADHLESALKLLIGHAIKFARASAVSLRVRFNPAALRLEFIVCEEDGGFPERTFSTPLNLASPPYPGVDILAAGQLCKQLGATFRSDDRPLQFTIHLPGNIAADGVFRSPEKSPLPPVAQPALG